MNISKVTDKVRKLDFKLGEGDDALAFAVEYKPLKINIPFMQELSQDMIYSEKMVSYLSELVKSWDFEDEDGNNIPPTREAMERGDVPLIILQVIFDAILSDVIDFRQELSDSKND